MRETEGGGGGGRDTRSQWSSRLRSPSDVCSLTYPVHQYSIINTVSFPPTRTFLLDLGVPESISVNDGGLILSDGSCGRRGETVSNSSSGIVGLQTHKLQDHTP